MKDLIIGSHVSFGKNQLLGSVEEALSYGSNTFMFYTGAPQNTIRKDLDTELTKKAYELMAENGISPDKVVCHAPYIINLANNKEKDKYNFSIDFLMKEVARCEELGIKILVLHPGSSVGLEKEIALKNIVYALNLVLENDTDVTIALETMAGKGSELGANLEELKFIIDRINKKDKIGVCLDTCHLNDSGIEVDAFDDYLDAFDREIGVDKIEVIHINDSKNPCGSHKDRHENIGFGTIGFQTLIDVIYSERLGNIPRILETPYIGDNDESKERLYPPYRFEIESIRTKSFNPDMRNEIRSFYRK